MKSRKFKGVSFNNRKKQLSVAYTSGKRVTLHYNQLGISTNIKDIKVDKETKGASLCLHYDDDRIDYLPYDQPLALVKDPEFVLMNHIELLTSHIKEMIRARGISKHYLAEQLGTSDNQIQRLLNPKILNKNLTQLYQMASLLGLELELKAA